MFYLQKLQIFKLYVVDFPENVYSKTVYSKMKELQKRKSYQAQTGNDDCRLRGMVPVQHSRIEDVNFSVCAPVYCTKY